MLTEQSEFAKPWGQAADRRLTNGRLSASVGKLAHTLWNDRHPVVMIFFILLLSIAEIMFLPPAWPFMSTSRKNNSHCRSDITIWLPLSSSF
ncbi:hypothetical protein DID88_004405 [Monilinia fructigena]|uniref:Uncharacterized protein n=1 Tax=Monilinia fructigena TaxID=38457 RepID=A0A395IQG5_9HELO|nr:hypothetical protein DID88_004405 [Monilinia fructigena]